jgi:hypothetical protein
MVFLRVISFQKPGHHFGVTRSQDFLLSFGNQARYTYTHTASPIPTPSSARLLGLWRVGDDL